MVVLQIEHCMVVLQIEHCMVVLQIEHCLRWTETGLKVATLVNFLVFLRQGVYLSLVERLLGVRAQFPQKQSMRQVCPLVFSMGRGLCGGEG